MTEAERHTGGGRSEPSARVGAAATRGGLAGGLAEGSDTLAAGGHTAGPAAVSGDSDVVSGDPHPEPAEADAEGAGRRAKAKGFFRRHLGLVRHLVALGLVVFAIVVLYGRRHEVRKAMDLLGHPAWGWLGIAIGAEAASMVVFARLQRWLLRCGGVWVPMRDMVEITLAGNALGTSLPGGAAWSAGWLWGQLRRRGANRVLAGWVVLVAGALASFALFLLVVAGAELAGNHGPVASLRWLGRSLLAIPILALVGMAWWRRSHWTQRWWAAHADTWRQAGGRRARVLSTLSHFGQQVQVVEPTPLAWIEALGLAVLNWVCDLVALVASIKTIHAHVPWRGIVVAYALTQISASLPITPGGLAVVEASLAALLTAYGMPETTAVAVVLLYRLLSFWVLVPIGWGAWALLEAGQRHGHRRSRRHPWAEHRHRRRSADEPPASNAPDKLIPPSPCLGCEDVPAGIKGWPATRSRLEGGSDEAARTADPAPEWSSRGCSG